MPPDDLQIEAAQTWLARARSSLLVARQAPLPGVFLEDLAFQAQQAVEKAVKAVYLRFGFAFRYTHDLEELFAGLESAGCTIPVPVRESITLTRFAVEARYPSPAEPLTPDELQEAIQLAETVLNWANQLISGQR
ncbi:MAG: HEPN domain-containing protein [Acidobacteriota bacterium]